MKNTQKIGKRVEFVLGGFGVVYGECKTVEKTRRRDMSTVVLEMNGREAWVESSFLKVIN